MTGKDMENDLVTKGSVLKLIEDIKQNPEIPKNYGTLLDIMRVIGKMPTAYDVDKVIETFETYKSQQFQNEMLSDNEKWLVQRVIDECTNIVKPKWVKENFIEKGLDFNIKCKKLYLEEELLDYNDITPFLYAKII